MSLDIIIVNWNSGKLLERCIMSIYESVPEIDFTIFIVDNKSCDDSMQNLPLKDREILIKSKTNLGFARACNKAAVESKSDFLLFLNPDTIIFPGSIEFAIKFISSESDAGIVGVRQELSDGTLLPSCSRFLRFRNLINDIFGLSKIFPGKFRPSTIMSDWDHSKSSIVDQIMGSFLLIRRVDFMNLNGFDEQFFMYYEDMDLAKRILANGKYSYYLNNVKIIHEGCGTSDKIKGKRLFYSLSSRIQYSKKHLSLPESFLITLVTFFPELFTRFIYFLVFRQSFNEAYSVLHGYWLLTLWLFKVK